MNRSGPGKDQSLFEYIKNLPPHMGWGSITAEKRRVMGLLPDVLPDEGNANFVSADRPEPDQGRAGPGCESNRFQNGAKTETLTADIERPQLNPAAASVSEPEPETVRIFGHVLDTIHRHKRDGCGRVWLLARHLDLVGEGRIKLGKLRHEICDPAGSLRCLSKKRLQQIVRLGEGVFWHRSADGRWLYYHSEARVAAALGMTAVKGFAVEVPIAKLVQKIRLVRATFYNAFHTTRGDGFNNPITRRVMQSRGMREKRTQRRYEAVEGISTRSQFAVIGQYSKSKWQRAQWEDGSEEQNKVGGPAFIYIDYKGILGKNPDRIKRPMYKRHWHNIYILRQIGNAYAGTLSSPKRGRSWTNQKIRHLCASMQKFTGSADMDDSSNEWNGKFYYDSDKDMQRALRRNGVGDERPLYSPFSGFNLNWDIEQPVDERRPTSTFYWQEAPPF